MRSIISPTTATKHPAKHAACWCWGLIRLASEVLPLRCWALREGQETHVGKRREMGAEGEALSAAEGFESNLLVSPGQNIKTQSKFSKFLQSRPLYQFCGIGPDLMNLIKFLA